MAKWRVRLKNNSWLPFDEKNDLMQIPNKIMENTILIKQTGDKLTNKINELQDRINKAVEYIKEHIKNDDEYPDYMEMSVDEYNQLLDLLEKTER